MVINTMMRNEMFCQLRRLIHLVPPMTSRPNLSCQHIRWNSCKIGTTGVSQSQAFSVSEINIPFGDGHYIAGKLWKGEESNDSKTPQAGNLPKISPIICLHGWLDNASSFDPLLPLILKPGVTAVAIDFPGHGFSSHFSNCTHYDPLDGFMSIYRTIRHFGFEKVTLLGHSMGSILSFVFAGIFPEFVDGYIALDNIRPISQEPIETIRKFGEKLLQIEEKLQTRQAPPAYTYDEILERVYLARDKTISREGCKILLERGAVQRPDGKYHFCHDLRVTIPTALGRYTIEQSTIIGRAIRCKVCILKGEPGTDYEPREEFLAVVEQLRRSGNKNRVEFHLIPGTHHFHINTPELIAPILNKFLWSK